jgi:hypothetical protein
VGGTNRQDVDAIRSFLKSKFEITDLGPCNEILGLKVLQNDQGIYIYQPKHIQQLALNLKLDEITDHTLPMVKDFQRVLPEGQPCSETMAAKYRSLIGGLLYIANFTRPDVSFAVSLLARHSHRPFKAHWKAAVRVLGYLQKTKNMGILYPKQSCAPIAYADSDFASCPSTRRSTSGIVVMFGAPIHWRSKLQSCVTLSTCEAETVALSIATCEALGVQQMLKDIYGNTEVSWEPISIFEDNKAARYIANNPSQLSKLKHVQIRHFFVREKVQDKSVRVERICSAENIADCLTKALGIELFLKHRQLLGITEVPSKN